MEKQTIEATNVIVSPEERARLVRFCARITKNVDVAEDLAQETLLEAWRNEHLLRDPQRRRAWLLGIARNICLRWLSAHRRDREYLSQPRLSQNLSEAEVIGSEVEDVLADDLDIEMVLERKELIELLDHALSLLPAETRMMFIQRYVEASPLAEIATQMKTNASAVAMRLQRGKLTLRRILVDEIGQDLPLYVTHTAADEWEKTPLWCHGCGQQRLLGQRDPGEGKLFLKCPVCNSGTDEVQNRNYLPILKGIKGYKPLYARLANWCDRYYRNGLRAGSVSCMQCGHMVPVSIQTPLQFPQWLLDKKETYLWMQYPADRVVAILCEHCRSASISSLESLVLESAPGQQFLQAHPRIRTLSKQYLEAEGRAAILTRFESITDTARLDIISDEETYEILRVYGGAL